MSDETLGKRVRRLREERGLSASRLGQLAGIRENSIYKIESGDTKQPEFSTGLRLARALRVSPDYLAGLERDVQSDLIVKLDDDTVIGLDVKVQTVEGDVDSAEAYDVAIARLLSALNAQVLSDRRLREAGVSLLPSVGGDETRFARLEERVDKLTRMIEKMAKARADAAEAEAAEDRGSRRRSGGT